MLKFIRVRDIVTIVFIFLGSSIFYQFAALGRTAGTFDYRGIGFFAVFYVVATLLWQWWHRAEKLP